MSSAYTQYPPAAPDTTTKSRDRVEQPYNLPVQDGQQHLSPSTPAYGGHLSPFTPQIGSSSTSPGVNTNTPAESVSTLSVHYQSSEFSEVDDPFWGVNFNALQAASPSFLDDDILQLEADGPVDDQLPIRTASGDSQTTQHVRQVPTYFPLSPDKSPSLTTGSPDGEKNGGGATRAVFPNFSQSLVAPRDLSTLTHQPSTALDNQPSGLQLTPKTTDSGQSSDDGLAPASATMHQSPRVMVSHWDRDELGPQTLSDQQQQRPGNASSGFSATRDAAGRWVPDHVTGQGGLEPSTRSAAEVPSINELASERKLSERNREVDDWLERSASLSPPIPQAAEQSVERPDDGDDNIPQREISLGNETENKLVPGQTYFVENGGELTYEDLRLMRQGRNWDDAPVAFEISQPDSVGYQPQTSKDAMERFQRMCRDNDSVVSRAATWGTRRFSMPSIVDAEVEATGNFLKKLSLSRGDSTRRSSILGGLKDFVRKPSVNLSKRSRAEPDDASSFNTESSAERREGKLAPPSPKPGWRKQSVPSINTAFVEVGSKVASIGATHARTSSISATPITSPKSPITRNLSVRKPLNRLRSKSDTSGIVEMWKKTGGPPVSNLGNPKVDVPEGNDDEDDDEDLSDDGDMKPDADKVIDDITPNLAGFQQHILKLNPHLSTQNTYLVDRIAHQQLVRYKLLLTARVKHLQAIAARNCSCGTMCIELGGSANILDAKGDPRGVDPLSARLDGEDGDITPLDGAINQESFPDDIPMPPTNILPAEFECQLCFTAKKFQKPSDWTKHVHEDVQPFTCTWDRCRDPKIFKRKADWVRHENEGHRHLEWWKCDVEGCTHTCYRRDNFLQHLVREHKFTEPKVKTKAAIKRAGAIDPTWLKVEQCHHETSTLPQQEPCRFCGRSFPTWKKLTVHLAKHMEQISLPILKLVAKRELDEDTIISPVQEPPPRPFPATFPTPSDQQPQHHLPFGSSPTLPQGPYPRGLAHPMAAYPNPAQQQPLMYPIAPPSAGGYHPHHHQTPNLYSPGFDDLSHGMAQAQISMQPPVPSHHTGFQSLNVTTQSPFSNLPVTATATTTSNAAYMASYMSMAPEIEPFPALSMNALGLQDPVAAVTTGAPAGSTVSALMDVNGVVVDQQEQQRRQHQQQQQFSPQGSVSPYGHSPMQPQGGFYH